MGSLLRAAAAWLFTGFFWSVVVFAHLLSLKSLSARRIQALIRLWGRTVLRIAGIRLELLNESTIRDRASRVVVINHQSALDLAWGAAICPEAPLVIGKKELIYVPFINLVWWALDFIRIDRANHVRAVAALAGVARTIAREKRSLVIAPEGTRSPDGKIHAFKKGAFHLAIESGAQVCPVVVAGAYGLLPKHTIHPKRGVIRVRFLPPVSTEGLTRADLPSLVERVRGEMLRAFDEMSRG